MKNKELSMKLINYIVAIIGLIILFWVNKEVFKSLTAYDIPVRRLLDIIVMDLGYVFVEFFILIDFSQKKLFSFLGVGLMIVAMVYTLLFGIIPDIKECFISQDFETIDILYMLVLLFHLLVLILPIVLILKYLRNKDKNNFFSKYNIFLLPIIDFFNQLKWVDAYSDGEYKEVIDLPFPNHIYKSLVWALVALVLYIRYELTKYQEQKGE